MSTAACRASSCMTTCPSGVNYMHLVDHGRHHIEQTYTRALPDRLMRRLLGLLMPRPKLFRWALVLGWLAKPLAAVLPSRSSDPGGATFLRRLKAMIEAIPAVDPGALAGRPAADLSGSRSQDEAGRADAGLRPAGAGARGQ